MNKLFLLCIAVSSVLLIQKQAISGSVTLSFWNSSVGSVRIQATGDYCVHSTSPDDFTLSADERQRVKINYKSGALTYCGWRHSHQSFSITQTYAGGVTQTAEIQWYKYTGGGDTIHVKKDDYNIIHVNYGDPTEIQISL